MCASFLLFIYHLGLLSDVCASSLLCIYHLGLLSYVCASLLSFRTFILYVRLIIIVHFSFFDLGIFCTSPLYFYLRIHFLMIRAFYYCASYSLLLRIHLSFNQGLFARPFLLLLRIHLFTSRALNHLLAFVPFFLCSFSILASARMRFYFSSSNPHSIYHMCILLNFFSLMYL